MLTLISPAKKLNCKPLQSQQHSQPLFIQQSEWLVERLRQLSALQVGQLMSLSPTLAELNHQRYQDFQLPFTSTNAHQALALFQGDVYLGLQASSLSEADLQYAQEHLRIISGLYGLLRPLDLIQEYRLEMGCKLNTDKGANLYQFWGQQLSQQIRSELAEHEQVLNLASKEYAQALPGLTTINCKFLDYKSGVYKSIFLYAKRARGLMARFIIQQRIDNPEQLKDFTSEDYSFCPKRSDGDNLVFIRKLR